jgi:hypothetical protein
VIRPKGDLIFQKSGRCYTSLSQSYRQPLLFDGKYPLTDKNSPPILPTVESNVLSKKYQKEFLLKHIKYSFDFQKRLLECVTG